MSQVLLYLTKVFENESNLCSCKWKISLQKRHSNVKENLSLLRGTSPLYYDKHTFVYFSNKDEITRERLSSAKIFVVAAPKEKFKVSEVGGAVNDFVLDGGFSRNPHTVISRPVYFLKTLTKKKSSLCFSIFFFFFARRLWWIKNVRADLFLQKFLFPQFWWWRW